MILHLVLGCLLLAIPAVALYLLDRKSLRAFLVAVVRMALQVLVLCLMVWVLIRYDRWWLSMMCILLAAGYAAFVVVRRMTGGNRSLILPVMTGLLAGSLPVGLYLLAVSLPSERVMEPHWLIPVMMLLLGHSLTMTLRGMNTYVSALKTDEEQYEFMRGNGADHLKAVMPFVRRAFQSVMSPTVANLQEAGLYTMPLLLCGFLMAGVSPVGAFVAMLLLTVGCVAASVVSLIVAIWKADGRLFDSFGKLRQG